MYQIWKGDQLISVRFADCCNVLTSPVWNRWKQRCSHTDLLHLFSLIQKVWIFRMVWVLDASEEQNNGWRRKLFVWLRRLHCCVSNFILWTSHLHLLVFPPTSAATCPPCGRCSPSLPSHYISLQDFTAVHRWNHNPASSLILPC